MNKISEFLLKIIIKDETNFKRIKNIIDKKERNPYVYAFGSTSMGGESAIGDEDFFTAYYLKNDMPSKVARLKEGLDEESKSTIDCFLKRTLLLPVGQVYTNFLVNKGFIRALETPFEKKNKKLYQKELPTYLEKYKFQIPNNKENSIDKYVPNLENLNPDTFYFHHGLRFQSEKLKAYIKDKDFIDGGAFVGDSAIMLLDNYEPKTIYSFELSEKNANYFENNMKSNNIGENKIKLVKKGLSDKKEHIFIHDIGGQSLGVFNKGDNEVILTDLDSFASENNLNIGFIKMDLEGAGLKGLLGMKEVIKRNRPVLSLAIYHTPEEFFEIVPKLKEFAKNYNIKVVQLQICASKNTETAVFAYPKEIDE